MNHHSPRRFGVLLAVGSLLLGLGPVYANVATPPALVAGEAPVAAPGVTSAPAAAAAEALALLQERGALPADAAAARDAVLGALAVLGGGGAYYQPPAAVAESATAKPATGAAESATPTWQVLRSVCLYLPASAVDAAWLQQLQYGVAKADGTSAVILDLRFAAGGDPAAVRGVLALLQKTPRRVLLLTGPATSGVPEILAVCLRAKAGASLVGAPTCGQCAVLKPVVLHDGGTLYLPDPVREFDGVPLPKGAVAPDIAVGGKGVAREAVFALTTASFAAAPEADAVLQRAVDLLLMAHALQAP